MNPGRERLNLHLFIWCPQTHGGSDSLGWKDVLRWVRIERLYKLFYKVNMQIQMFDFIREWKILEIHSSFKRFLCAKWGTSSWSWDLRYFHLYLTCKRQILPQQWHINNRLESDRINTSVCISLQMMQWCPWHQLRLLLICHFLFVHTTTGSPLWLWEPDRPSPAITGSPAQCYKGPSPPGRPLLSPGAPVSLAAAVFQLVRTETLLEPCLTSLLNLNENLPYVQKRWCHKSSFDNRPRKTGAGSWMWQ